MRSRLSFVVGTLTVPIIALGCGGDPAPAPVAPPGATAAPTAEPAAPAEPTWPQAPLTIPESGDPANHYLDHETLFAAQQKFGNNFVYAWPAKQLGPKGQDGQAPLWNFATKKEDKAPFFWKTRAAKPDELAVGQLALLMHKKGPQGIYAGPTSVKEAYDSRWWIARIVSVRPRSEGYVLLSGGHRAAPGAIRLLEGDDSPVHRKQGEEDSHFIADEHWFVGRAPLPERSFMYLDPGVPAKPDAPFEGGEGRFVALNSGAIILTSHAWQTRKATPADLKKGQLVVLPHLKDGKVYRVPKTRSEALATRWWAVKIDGTENLSKGTVTVEGSYEASVDALRIVKK
ncbi:MAG: hypothetical protein JRI23_22050 [Deltaproteobacteria bacterium]|jgi:hypothetical protein|nr:hypothetical protein [Deltaproteobacteria bacterium]MBW2534642.1 hypothetical protein [Deltaproteobacteria bacterium]